MNRRTFIRSLGSLGVVPAVTLIARDTSRAFAQTGSSREDSLERNNIGQLLSPEPKQWVFTNGITTLDPTWSVTATDPVDARSAALAERISEHLLQLGGPRLRNQDLRHTESGQRQILLVNLSRAPVSRTGNLLGEHPRAGQVAQMLASHESRLLSRPDGPAVIRREAYHLSIEHDRVVVAAHALEGLIFGGQTLMQLMTIGALGKPGRLPQGTVVDWPSTPLRGYLADVRKPPWGFAGPAFDGWKSHLDRLAAMKCNYVVFEQSYGFQYSFVGETVGLPTGLRTESGRALSDYANARAIMIIPMIELSQGDSLRSFMAKFPSRHPWMLDHQKKGFCPFNEASYAFIDRMLAELATAFPYSPYLHLGEDETGQIEGSDACPRCRQAVAKLATDVGGPPDPIGYPMAYFQARVSELAKRHGKQTMVWGTFAFLQDNGIRQVVPKVMPKDVIVWDWMEKGFAKLGYQTWLPYLPSWEWKGPGVRELITHMVAYRTRPAWEGKTAPTRADLDAFTRSWSLSTFGVNEPDIGRRCLATFGSDPYGWPFERDLEGGRWLRVRFGAYLLLRPEEFRDPKNRFSASTRLEEELTRLEQAATFFEQLAQRALLNRSLAAWYARGIRLSMYAVAYVQSLDTAHRLLQQARAQVSDSGRRQLLEAAQQELKGSLDRFDGPIADIARLSLSQLGGPIIDWPRYHEYDVTGTRNGVRKAVSALLTRVTQLVPTNPVPEPSSLGLFPAVA